MSDSSYTYEANETGNKVSLVGSTLIASSTPSRLPTAANSQLQLWNLVRSIPFSRYLIANRVTNAVKHTKAFKYLDIQSYATVQSVCPAWHSTCVFYNVGIHVLENRVNQGIKEATKLIRNSKNLKAYVKAWLVLAFNVHFQIDANASLVINYIPAMRI